MRKILLLALVGSVLNSCGMILEKKPFNFDNFNNTPNEELAKAVRADDPDEINEIVKDKKINIDLKDPLYNQTLLALAIENEKEEAFVALLKAGANPNELVGEKDATPFVYGIKNVRSCNLFYVETMLKYGADPNHEIKNPYPGRIFFNSFPLFVAIGNQTHYCLDLIRLLVDRGADINSCYKEPDSDFCEGVIGQSITLNDMETLRYFVVEKNIKIPDTVIIFGGINKSTQKAYGLKEVLSLKKYSYQDFELDGKMVDLSIQRKARNEILDYLEKKK